MSNKLNEILEYLQINIDSKKFGLRDGYIYSYVIKKIRFELFIRTNSISLKYPIPNIDGSKIEFLSNLLNFVNPNFK